MNKTTNQQELAALLKQTAKAHHQAFITTNGEDRDWPKWYAKYLLDHDVKKILRSKMLVKDIENLLEWSEKEYKAQNSQKSWEDFYAGYMINSCGC